LRLFAVAMIRPGSSSIPWENFPPGRMTGKLLPDEVAGGTWSSPTLLMYSGPDHSLPRGKAWPEFASFVNAVAVSGGWRASIPPKFIMFEKLERAVVDRLGAMRWPGEGCHRKSAKTCLLSGARILLDEARKEVGGLSPNV
jgi:hypothetical protein